MINKKAVFCITVKNEEKNLPKFFKILDEIKKIFFDNFTIFIESDSKDNSVKIIKNYILHKKKNILISKNFQKSLGRSKKLEISRNLYLNYIKKNKFLSKFDYMIVLDCDGVNNKLNRSILENSLKKKNWSVIFGNQKIFYYDIWALRIKNLIEKDCFKSLIKNSKNNKLPLKKTFYYNISKFFFLYKHFNRRYIEVISAFGGIGIYKIKNILKFSYSSKNGTECEHVAFNKKIKKNFGKLYIDKKLIN